MLQAGRAILELLARLQRDFSLTLILISHSLPAIAQLATNVAIMQAGRFVECGSARDILHAPRHPYTRELLSSVPRIPA